MRVVITRTVAVRTKGSFDCPLNTPPNGGHDLCVVGLQDDGLSWITANRVLKRRLDAHVSAGLLALMVALEALVPPDHWQLRHRAGPQLRKIISALSKAL